MNSSFGFSHFLTQADLVGWIVFLLLLAGSITTWYLIVAKGLATRRTARHSQAFLTAFWAAPDLGAVAAQINRAGAPEPFSHVVQHGLVALEHLQARRQAASLDDAGSVDDVLTRALRRAIDEDKTRLEYGQTILATVASSAPFVGLLGTVWGIYHALLAIGQSQQATLDKVAGPVGEALVMTGLGLAVAIPAAIAYNAFAKVARNTLAQLNSFAYDVQNFLASGVKSARVSRVPASGGEGR